MDKENLGFVMSKLGYTQYYDEKGIYYLPVKKNMKFLTPLREQQLIDYIELITNKPKKTKEETTNPKPRGWNLKK